MKTYVDNPPRTEEEIREVVNLAFPGNKSWSERSEDEKYAFRVIGSEWGPYVVATLLKLLDIERAKK